MKHILFIALLSISSFSFADPKTDMQNKFNEAEKLTLQKNELALIQAHESFLKFVENDCNSQIHTFYYKTVDEDLLNCKNEHFKNRSNQLDKIIKRFISFNNGN